MKLPRSLLESPIYTAPHILQTLIHILLKANFRPAVVEFNGCTVSLEPGQCIFGRKKWANDLHMSETQVYGALRKLTDYGFITVQAKSKYSIITVSRWEDYQTQPEQQPTPQQSNSKTTAERLDIQGVDGDLQQQNTQQSNSGATQKKKDKNDEKINTAFEEFWAKYPNRFNKPQTMKNFAKTAKAHGTEAVLRALDNYNAEIERNGTDKRYITRSTNFVGQKAVFMGYLDDETGVASNEPAVQPAEDVLARLRAEGGF